MFLRKQGLQIGGSGGKASAYNVGDLGSVPGLERSPGEGSGNSLQYSYLLRGRRSLVGYSPWDRKSGTQLSDFTFTFITCEGFSYTLFCLFVYVASLLLAPVCKQGIAGRLRVS